MEHIIAYEGQNTSLGIMQKEYIPLFVSAINRRIGIEGTLHRPPYMREHGEDFLKLLVESRHQQEVFAVLRREQNGEKVEHTYIGHMGLHRMDWKIGTAITGSMIVQEGGRGKGHGTEAKLFLLYHAFYILGLRKISSRVKAFNAQSLGHLLKTGYQVIGVDPKHEFHEGTFVDEVMLCIFREQFDPVWKKYQETKELPSLTEAERTLVRELSGTK